jgi:two-component system, cell cycle response regulator
MPARILVIEDNLENLELMGYLLTAFGHTVRQATDGVEGLQLARKEKPDLILCDVQMRKLDGFEVVRRVREDAELSDMTIVGMTAYAMRDDQDRVMSVGFDGYISKPIVPEEFVNRAEEFLSVDLHLGAQLRTTAAQEPYPAPGPKNIRATILAVDDRRVNLSLMSEALELARLSPPDLILSDVHIPETGGYQFLEAVRGDRI